MTPIADSRKMKFRGNGKRFLAASGRFFFRAFIPAFLCVLFSACSPAADPEEVFRIGMTSGDGPVTAGGFCLDTYVTISLYPSSLSGIDLSSGYGSASIPPESYSDSLAAAEGNDPEKLAEKITEDALCYCSYLEENCFSRTFEGSTVWRINHSHAQAVTLDEDTEKLLEEAGYYYELSGGLADPSIGAVSDLWDFHTTGTEDGPSTSRVPSAEALAAALEHVGFDRVEIADDTVTLKDSDMMLDLGFIAKGYIADALRDRFYPEGSSGVINLGGNVLVIGDKPGSEDGRYTVGIEKPFGNGDILLTIRVKDCAVVTSGIYERCFTENGILYHHILDIHTGMPVQNGLYSVTIVSDNATMADALSTVCFLLGKEKGLELIETIDGAEALFIDDQLTLTSSSGFPKTSLCSVLTQ